MQIYGDLDFQNVNEIQRAKMAIETSFVSGADLEVGRLAFVDNKVYICIEATTPIWVPMTNVISTYIHTQDASAETWNVQHNLNTGTPIVMVYDTQPDYIIPADIEPVDNNNLTISFSVGNGTAGKAIISTGGEADFLGLTSADSALLANPQQVFLHTQTAAASSWVITHALGFYPKVHVFRASDDQEILPVSVVHNSKFTTTITFSSALAGRARFI